MNTPADRRIGTVGRPSACVTIRIADDGEILMSGESVFSAYWHNPTATGETLIDGWLHTGDIGELDNMKQYAGDVEKLYAGAKE